MTSFVIEGRQPSVGLHGVMTYVVKEFGGVVTMHPRPVRSLGDIVGESVVSLRVNVKEDGGESGGSANVTSTGRVDGDGACDFTMEDVGE